MWAIVINLEEKTSQSKKTGNIEKYCKLVLQQNNDSCECIAWPEDYARNRGVLSSSKGKIVIMSGTVKYSEFQKKNGFQLAKSSVVELV